MGKIRGEEGERTKKIEGGGQKTDRGRGGWIERVGDRFISRFSVM